MSEKAPATKKRRAVQFNLELIKRYDKAGPRYTSYPTAVQFTESFNSKAYAGYARQSNEPIPRPLSLYFHIPFCSTLCFYCACNKFITKKKEHGVQYLDRLFREIEMQGRLYDQDRRVEQFHLGGGTPTFLSMEQLSELLRVAGRHFTLLDDDRRDFSIEVDPRTITAGSVEELKQIGFNRISLGVQDFDPKVQRAIHRLQSEESTLAILEAAHSLGFRSTSVDLIYGLPFQGVESFGTTVEKIIKARPGRLSVFNYAHLPDLFSPQQRINAEDLPSPEEKLDILSQTINQLTGAGYRYIGMDHFALEGDELSEAQDSGTLYRNFQGYATHSDCDLVGLGITSISQVGDCYSQNDRDLESYYARIDKGKLAVVRGIGLTEDDRIRRWVISQLMCYGQVGFSAFTELFDADFFTYFKEARSELGQLEEDGLVVIDEREITVEPAGRLLMRNVCMVFDAYIPESATKRRFSRMI
ncbi:MAG: oxygen-independent coproporphyrinogen III oxidase [Arenicellales bacterium]|jgi:oxygen-independent coproporphyrinogen-3 oxidase|nr:oxygen-independent coproporphyrinogen III oxidase [Arenicellales bacterium]